MIPRIELIDGDGLPRIWPVNAHAGLGDVTDTPLGSLGTVSPSVDLELNVNACMTGCPRRTASG